MRSSRDLKQMDRYPRVSSLSAGNYTNTSEDHRQKLTRNVTHNYRIFDNYRTPSFLFDRFFQFL